MKNIISLDEDVLKTLDFFSKNKPPQLDVGQFNTPFVVGSGNAYNTGLILFSEKAAVFADESNFKTQVEAYKEAIENKQITQAVIISASGGKDSIWEIELAKKNMLHSTLLTTKEDSQAARLADTKYVFESIDEPYTYNTSTYMGMVLAVTKENPDVIKNCVSALRFPSGFDKYRAYAFVVADKYLPICAMLDIKKDELFGPHLSLRAFTQGHARHAKFVNPWEEELVVSIGYKNEYFGEPGHKWDIFPPNDLGFAGIMALTYYIIGKIQDSKPQYFKENIEKYVTDFGPKAYGSKIPFDLIVPGTRKKN